MDNGQLVKSISEISKKEAPLLYYYPKEVERAISDGRLITVCENGKNIGFGFWHSYGNWIELSTMYIAPEFRGKGYSAPAESAALAVLRQAYEKHTPSLQGPPLCKKGFLTNRKIQLK